MSRVRHAGGKRSATGSRHGVSLALQNAIRTHQQGHLELAEPLYRKALQIQPGQPDALHFFGVLCHQRGRSDEAVALIKGALQRVPRHADAHNNLGNVHKECGRLAEAEACYRSALDCSPDHVDALSNLALVLEAQGRTMESRQAYAALLAVAPRQARAHYLMGIHLRNHPETIEDVEQSVSCFRKSDALDPAAVCALEALGVALYMLGRREEAIAVYRAWGEREPNNPVPRHMLASCGGLAAPARADDDYVRKVFDEFADSFDAQLLNNLDYRAPKCLVAALAGVLDAPQGALRILDAGCGTGLCGPLIRPYAKQLVGVDLSAGMVAKARQRGDYDVLAEAELTAYLAEQSCCWDVVLSADTLVYFGDLLEVLSAAHASLNSGGWLGFTLEELDDVEDRSELSASGRYRHSRRHVQRVLETIGFGQVSIVPDTLRKEVGRPVAGLIVLARRSPG